MGVWIKHYVNLHYFKRKIYVLGIIPPGAKFTEAMDFIVNDLAQLENGIPIWCASENKTCRVFSGLYQTIGNFTQHHITTRQRNPNAFHFTALMITCSGPHGRQKWYIDGRPIWESMLQVL